MNRVQRATYAVVVPIRRVLYRLGRRPRLGSIWHSPSLDLTYRGRALAQLVARQIEEQLDVLERERRRHR